MRLSGEGGFRVGLLLLGLCFSLNAQAESLVVVCYNWGCQQQVAVVYADAWLKQTLIPLSHTKTPAEERAVVAEIMRQFYIKAAEQTPIGADQPENNEDPSVIGRMDCIDHSFTTRNVLMLLAHKKALRWHDVGTYAHRSLLVGSHYSATLIETVAPSGMEAVYTIDPWAVAPGDLPVVSGVREWAGYRFYTLEAEHHTTAAKLQADR